MSTPQNTRVRRGLATKATEQMEVTFFDIGIVSVYIGREERADWGTRSGGWNTEVWAGRTYVCATFHQQRVTRLTRKLIIAAAAFSMGWMMEPPQLTASQPALTQSMEASVEPLDI